MVVSGVFIWLIVVNTVAPDVHWEAGTHPGKEIIVRDKFLWDVMLPVMGVWLLVVHVANLIGLVPSMASSCSKCSYLRSEEHLLHLDPAYHFD